MIRALVLLALASLGLPTAREAEAATFFFDTVPETSPYSRMCAEPCFEVRMFHEDPTRELDIEAIQFDLMLGGSATLAAPFGEFAVVVGIPAIATNADEAGAFSSLPWKFMGR